MKTIESLGDLKGKKVLVRSDFNVPLDDEGNITDAGRIDASIPTLKALLDGGAKVIVTAHLGRPKGEVNPKYSLAPFAEALSEALGQYVALAGDVSGEDAHERANGLNDGDVLLLENVRFEAAETSKDDAERGVDEEVHRPLERRRRAGTGVGAHTQSRHNSRSASASSTTSSWVEPSGTRSSIDRR